MNTTFIIVSVIIMVVLYDGLLVRLRPRGDIYCAAQIEQMCDFAPEI